MDNAKFKMQHEGGMDILKEFQLAKLSVNEKSTPEFGKNLSKKIWGYTIAGLGGYFFNRNARYQKNRDFANGRINVQQMFQDRFQFNAKQNYIRLVWNTLQICNRIVSGLVGRWMQRGEKVVVQAIDDLSQLAKKDEYDFIEHTIKERERLAILEQQSGIPMMPQDEGLPKDKEELELWKLQFQRIPEEIEIELGCNEVLGSNGWNDVLKEMALHDSAETGFVGTYVYMDDNGVIHVEKVEPENAIYGYSKYYDFRDVSWLGDAPTFKLSTLRRWYGKEFNPDNPNALTEEQLWQIAQTCKEYSTQTNLVWNSVWNTIYLRPYDEWNVRGLRFELRTVDTEPYTITQSKSTGTTYTQKGYPTTSNGNRKEKPSDNQQLLNDSNVNIYRGVYLPDNDILLEWGLKKNMIRPQDPKEIGNAEFSYSYYMYQNYELRNLAIPEKIEAAIDGMILSLLKMQQVVARMRPTGAAVNEDALQNIDYGLGQANSEPIDHKRLYDQTGDIYYRGRDAEGNPIPVPIVELKNSGFLDQMSGLIQIYQFWYQTLKDELGEDPNLISAALQPRVTGTNVQASQQMSEYATDYMYRAFAECIKMTARKVTCLLRDSVTYGAKAYRTLVKSQDIGEREFSTDIRFLPTQQEVSVFEQMMNQAVMANQELIMFINPFRLTQMAKEDVKLAWIMFEQGQKKCLIHQMQQAQQNQQATIEGQIASAQAAEKAKQETESLKGNIDLESKRMEGETANKNAVLTLATSLLSKGEPIPAYLQPLINATIENIMIPMVVANEQQKMAIIQQMQQAQQPQQPMPPEQQGMEQQAMAEQQNQSQPPPMAA